MGIPYLFRHFARQCPRSVRIVESPEEVDFKYGQLYIDFNSVIHACAREVFASEGQIVQSCIEHVDHLIRMIQPNDFVYLAIDGKPPRAKMHQQRYRRFMSANSMEIPWDTNAVTPGTAFMTHLSRSLRDEAARRNENAAAAITWLVSGSDEEGEGEQKIMQHARTIKSLRAAVYGLDADLLLMSMTFLAGKQGIMHIVREQDLRGPLQIVNTTDLSMHVSKEMGQINASVVEFTALCSLLGNDFVPALPGLRIRDGGIDAVTRAYRSARSSGSEPLASGGPASLGGFNVCTLSKILELLAKDEGWAVQEAERLQSEARTRAIENRKKTFELFPLLEGYDGVSVLPGKPGWRPRYYRKLFGRGGIPPSIRSLCSEYVAGLAWSSSYMSQNDDTHKCLSMGWHYPHAYAPTALDLHMTTGSRGESISNEIDLMFEEADRSHLMGERIVASLVGDSCAWQLLLVLPLKSMHLLPDDRLREIMKNMDHGCVHMFPDGFMVATYLKEKMHECIPLLPAIDTRLLTKALLSWLKE